MNAQRTRPLRQIRPASPPTRTFLRSLSHTISGPAPNPGGRKPNRVARRCDPCVKLPVERRSSFVEGKPSEDETARIKELIAALGGEVAAIH